MESADKGPPLRSTVWAYLDRREWDGTLTSLCRALNYAECYLEARFWLVLMVFNSA